MQEPRTQAEPHQDWHVEALWQQLSPLLPGIGIEVLARTESTNTALLDRVRHSTGRGGARTAETPYGRRSEDLLPCLLVAEQQTHGRGRIGRFWQSGASGSLTFSLGLPLDLADWSGLSLAVGCAIAEALDPLYDGPPRLLLKWPNDLWLADGTSGRKLAGILIETLPAGTQRMVVVGVGINVSELARNPDATPSQFNTGFAALDEIQDEASAPGVLAQVALPLAQALVDFARHGFAPWQAAYARRDLLRGRHITAGALDGIGRGINAQGELLIETPAGLQAVGGGEVSVRLLPPSKSKFTAGG